MGVFNKRFTVAVLSVLLVITQTAMVAAQSGSPGGNAEAAARKGPKDGTYTIWPRLQATQAGLPAEIWIPQITVSGDFIIIYFASGPTGDFSDGRTGIRFNAWRNANNVELQDLDNPSRFYRPVSIRYSDNGGGTIWSMSFNRFTAVRFKLSCTLYNEQPQIFEEIILGEPDEE